MIEILLEILVRVNYFKPNFGMISVSHPHELFPLVIKILINNLNVFVQRRMWAHINNNADQCMSQAACSTGSIKSRFDLNASYL